MDSGNELVLQTVTRVRRADGIEVIRGTLLAEFVASERETNVFVAFCPPFEYLPEVAATAADEDFGATVKVAQRLHNGAQFEVRLPEPAEEPLALSIEFSAVGQTFLSANSRTGTP